MGLEDLDLSMLSDDDLAAKIAQLSGDPAASETTTETEAPPSSEAAAPPAAQDPAPAADPAPQGAPETEPQKDRGDLTVALRQSREQERLYRDTLNNPQALAQHLAQMGYQVLPAQQQTHQLPEQLEFLDPDLAQYTQAQLEGMRGEVGQQLQGMRLEMSEALAKQVLPDFDQTLQGLLELRGDPVLGPIIQAAGQQFANHPNPAMAFYQLGKRLAGAAQPSEDVIQAKAKQLAEQMAAEALAKQKAPLEGPQGLARAGAVNPGAPIAKRPDQMTDAELEEAAAQARRQMFK